MSIKKIPAHEIVTCDCCKRDATDRRAMSAHLTINRAGLDYQGMAVGPGGTSMDLCDSCCIRVEEAIAAVVAKVSGGA